MAAPSKMAHLTREEVLEICKKYNRAKSKGEVKSLDEWLKINYGFSARSLQEKIKATVGLKKMDKNGFYPIEGVNMTRTSLYISKDMLKSIKTEALKQDTTFNDITRKLLKKWLFENER